MLIDLIPLCVVVIFFLMKFVLVHVRIDLSNLHTIMLFIMICDLFAQANGINNNYTCTIFLL